jgi:hypothetical protein
MFSSSSSSYFKEMGRKPCMKIYVHNEIKLAEHMQYHHKIREEKMRTLLFDFILN